MLGFFQRTVIIPEKHNYHKCKFLNLYLNWLMQALTLHFTGDSNHTIARVGPCVFTLTLINQFKYGGSGRSRTCFHKLYNTWPCIRTQAELVVECTIAAVTGSTLYVQKCCMPALCFNHVKLPTHIKAHLNSPSTLVAISPTRGRNSVCFYMETRALCGFDVLWA